MQIVLQYDLLIDATATGGATHAAMGHGHPRGRKRVKKISRWVLAAGLLLVAAVGGVLVEGSGG